MRQLAWLCLASVALTSAAWANGRPPATSTLHFRQGSNTDVVGGMTFGLVISHDSGATWRWMCEAAVGYAGIYDPHYVYAASGSLFATTIANGLRVNRDGCTFVATPLGAKVVSAIVQGPDATVYAALSDPSDVAIYATTNDGMTFTSQASPGQLGDWWQTIAVAPSSAARVYLSGFRPDTTLGRTFLLFRSDDSAAHFAALPVTAFATSTSSTLEIAGISPSNPDLVFVRVTFVHGTTVGDAIYRSADAGQTFVKVFEAADSLEGFVVRANGDVIIGTPGSGFFKSSDAGMTFQALAVTPTLHASCLAETSAGVLWACTQNYGSEAMGIATSSDGATWTSQLHFQDIEEPVPCSAGTPQFDTCQTMVWCGLRAQLGISSQIIACGSLADPAPAPDMTVPSSHGGCCRAGSGDGGVVLAGLTLLAVFRRRSPRAVC